MSDAINTCSRGYVVNDASVLSVEFQQASLAARPWKIVYLL